MSSDGGSLDLDSALDHVNQECTGQCSCAASDFNGGDSPAPGGGGDGPHGSDGNIFTIVVVPDTQFMVLNEGYKGAWNNQWIAQADWIVANQNKLNIQGIAHVGDVTEFSGFEDHWSHFFEGWGKVESTGIPWSVVPGNHDCYCTQRLQWDCNRPDRWKFFNQHMGPRWQNVGTQYETFEKDKFENHVVFFDAMPKTGAAVPMMIVGLEYGRIRQEVLDWAAGKLAEHPHRRAILNIHFVAAASINIQNWAKEQKNIFMIHQGHDCAREWNKQYNNNFGEPIQEILTDYQCSGNGRLRYYTFNMDTDTVNAYTYSPHEKVYESDWNSQFSFAFSK